MQRYAPVGRVLIAKPVSPEEAKMHVFPQ